MKSITRWIRLLDAIVCRTALVCRWFWPIAAILVAFVIAPGLAILVVSGILGYCLWQPVASSGGSTHGTAAWATARDLIRSGCLFQNEGVFIGHSVGLRFSRLFSLRMLLKAPLFRSREIEALTCGGKRSIPLITHIPDRYPTTAVFAASGTGKSTCFAIPLLLRCPDAVVVLDAKGELCANSAKHRWAEFDSHIIVIDPFDVTEFESARFNPLDLYRDDPSQVVDEARRLANAIVVRSGEENDPFWSDSAVNVITCVLVFLMTEAKPEDATLSRARDILTNPQLVDQMLDMMMASDACFGLSRRLAGEVRGLEGKVRSSVFAVANTQMAFLDSLPVANVLHDSTFDPRELLTGNPTIYVCLPMDRIRELASVQRLILTALVNMVFAAGESSTRRIRLVLDEAASLGPMECLYNSVQFGRSFGLRNFFLFQSASQVERVFPGSQKQDFFGSVAAVYAGTNDYETAKSVSDWIGQQTVRSVTSQVSTNEGRSSSETIGDQARNRNWGSSDSASVAETGRLLMRPEEVLQLPPNLAIALVPNVPPILVEKAPYYAKTRRRLLRKTARLVANCLFIAASVVVLGPVFWVCTIGQSHPFVAEQIAHFQRMVFGR